MRNTDFKFVNTDSNALLRDMIRVYERMTEKTLSPASQERLYIQWATNIIIILLRSANYAGNQNLPSRAEGGNLDELGELFQSIERPKAQPAFCTVRFHLPVPQDFLVTIPVGVRVTDSSGQVRWETIADNIIPIGDEYIDLPVRCTRAGVFGNGFMPGQINTFLDIPQVPIISAVENTTESAGGAEEADDEEYYELLRRSQDSYSTAGARGSYIYHAMKVSKDIGDVIPNSPSPGQVDIYVLMKDGTMAGEEIKNAVYASCNADDARPLTDKVVMKDPEYVDYNIDFKYFVYSHGARFSLNDTKKAVNQAVNDYISWQAGKLGRDINPDELLKYVRRASGVKRLEITAPAFTALRDGLHTDENKQPQIARINSVNIESGGFEHE